MPIPGVSEVSYYFLKTNEPVGHSWLDYVAADL